jgi:membrane protein YqaA with SNARE-associated domain
VLFGTLSTAFGSVVSYWLGNSAGSARAGDAIRNIAQHATTPTAGQVAGKVIDAAVKTVAKR